MRASILIVGHPFPDKVEFGADHCVSYDEALEIFKKDKYAVVVAADKLPSRGKTDILDSFDFLHRSRKLNEDMQMILVSAEASPQELQKVINDVGLFKVIPRFETESLQLAVREALEEYELIKQNQAFLTLTREQYDRLQHLTSLLEEKVKAREMFLIEAREKLFQATKRTEALNRALVAIQRSVTKQEIEQHLTDALHVALGITWIRILFNDQNFLQHIGESKPSSTTIFSAPLFRDSELLGHIYFARGEAQPFTSDEDDFLLQVGDAVGLAMDRLRALEAIEHLKQEWDSTFDSITDPVAIISEDYEILRANLSYAKKSKRELEKITQRKCYEILFHRDRPCANCRLGTSFELGEMVCGDGTVASFDVTSHSVTIGGDKKTFALFYRDVGEERRIQRQILESSKMAEIGTIGSSIAHEINNPLGGMIAFLQILKGEIKPGDKIYADVNEMEQAAIRCKTIVENLLAFTRQSVSSEMKLTRVGDLVKLVSNIMELQTRGLGITLEKQVEDADAKVAADTNQLVQVLVNVMQNSCEAIAQRLVSQRSPAGKIRLKVHYNGSAKEELVFEITDNGTGIQTQDLPRVFTPFFTTKEKSKNPGLGLSVSYQIVKEHGGQMEISSVYGQSTTVAVTLKVAKSPTH